MDSQLETQDLLFTKERHVATITLNRPRKLNTMTADMGRELFKIADELNEDDNIRVVILTGTGERAFSAGTDVKVIDEFGTNWQLRNRKDYCTALWTVRKPIIASIRG